VLGPVLEEIAPGELLLAPRAQEAVARPGAQPLPGRGLQRDLGAEQPGARDVPELLLAAHRREVDQVGDLGVVDAALDQEPAARPPGDLEPEVPAALGAEPGVGQTVSRCRSRNDP